MTADETVALYDEHGVQVGAVPRSRMRAENLRHGATAVLVRDGLGRVYVHRRTTTKDVYPGLLDFAAGGVLLAGEDPTEGAAREAEEELGVHGVPLTPLGTADYADAASTYRAFRYTVTYDGPIRWQPEEVSWGDWFTVDALRRLIAEVPDDVVPDSRALWAEQLEAWAADRVLPSRGWDSHTSIIEGRWVDRSPQRADVAPWLLAETRLLPLIAHRLPLPVPVPAVVEREPLVVRHRLVVGEPCDPASLTAHDGRVVGGLLRVLHDLPGSIVTDAAVRSAADDVARRLDQVAEFRAVVEPLVPPSFARAADRLLQAVGVVGEQALCHADLLPEHLLVRGGRVSGVIDWCDCRVTDPALDFAWVLGGTSDAFAEAAAGEYGLTPAQRARAADWFALLPWYAVHRAVSLGDDVALRRDLPALTRALERWGTVRGGDA